MWHKVQEANTLRAKLGQALWFYVGDVNIACGGTAVTVDRTFGFATIVEMVELYSATNDADGLVAIERGTVTLDRADLATRRRFRSAMETVGLTMADLIRDYPGEERWKVMAEIARAVWIYGYRDTDPMTVICFDEEAAADNDPDIWTVDETVADESSLDDRFLEELYS